jgi:hypothetical protein
VWIGGGESRVSKVPGFAGGFVRWICEERRMLKWPAGDREGLREEAAQKEVFRKAFLWLD